jgi:UDPglucose 6-dehydrogenase
MFELSKIGIVGIGFVGAAIRDCSNGFFRTICIDVDPEKTTGTYADLHDCEAVFVCVPSPAKENGECDTSILNSVLFLLKDYKNVIISKTTAPPQFYEKMQKVYPNLVHIPEFLTAENALKDFSSQQNLIIGGQVIAYQREAERILKSIQPIKTVAFCSIGEAALSKYIINSFLATKVVFMNEMYELAIAHNYNWHKIRSLIDIDERIGKSHTRVPGPDSTFGFGGMCFPKDTSALIKYADKLSVNLNVLKTAVKKNTLLRLQKPK